MLQTSIRPPTTASSQKLSVTAATVHSTAITSSPNQSLTGGGTQQVVVTVTTDCFFRMTSSASTVVATDGTDMFLSAGGSAQSYRVGPVPDGYYLHFIRSTADGSAYITPSA